jgi:heme oxygenase (biliverdin-producing, ferredoxin)
MSRLLLSHAYVRYLGDLSGGQIIRKRLVKAYDLPGTGDGVRFYIFSDGNGKQADPKEIKELKEWFRGGMDAGVGDDDELKGEWRKHRPCCD